MKELSLLLTFISMMSLSSCKLLHIVINIDKAPITTNIPSSEWIEGIERLTYLPYEDKDQDMATSCEVSSLVNLEETSSCSCDASGLCSVGLTPSSTGSSTFYFNVTTNNLTSSTSKGEFIIYSNSTDIAPFAYDLLNISCLKNTERIVTLSYQDPNGDLATSCSLTELSEITLTTPCSCNLVGVCTVGLTGNSIGNASFSYTVIANSKTSNTASVELSIYNLLADFPFEAQDLPPETQNLPEQSALNNLEKTITLLYTDPNNDLATSCQLSSLLNVTETTPCSCDIIGICTVGVTGTPVGAASFSYSVTANNQNSNISQVTLNIANAPAITANSSPAGEYQLIEKTYTLSYTDTEGDLATACTVSGETNATITTPCTCNGSGVCTVGITGDSAAIAGGASFDYTVTTNAVESNAATVTLTINQIGASINDEWIKVPANAGNIGLPAFYVMKYEARAWMKKDPGVTANEDNVIDAGEVDPTGCDGAATCADNWVETIDPAAAQGDATDYLPASIGTSQPWRETSATNAALRCQALGANYQLISNDHWMAIAKDLEEQGENWTGGAIGDGCLYRGNTGEGVAGTYITDPADMDNTDNCGYNASTDPDSGITRDLRAIHTLSNGSQIYDFAGNVWEWTDWEINDPLTPSTLDFTKGPNSVDGNACPSPGWEQFEDVVCPALDNDDYLPLYPDPSPTDYSNLGFGQFYGGAGGAALRGGSWVYGSDAGVFALFLGYGPTNSSSDFGLRCVFVLGP